MPASLPASRLSTQGAKPIRAAIIVDAPRVVLAGLTVDLSVANLSGCAPIVAGIYLRNASGVLDNLTETGAHATGATDCDTGVGLLIEGGKLTDDFGKPVNRKAVVSLRDSDFHDNQKGGIVATGDGAIVKIRDTGVFGQGAASVGVPNGIELSFGVKSRLQSVQVRDFQSPVAGKTGTGILAFGASKARLRQSTLTGMQTGVFVVGDGLRILDSQLGEFSSDGMVFIGSKNRGLGNRIEVSSVSGVFIDGDRNTVRGGNITDMPVGVWFFSGDRNIAKGIDFENVAQPERVGDVRDLFVQLGEPAQPEVRRARGLRRRQPVHHRRLQHDHGRVHVHEPPEPDVVCGRDGVQRERGLRGRTVPGRNAAHLRGRKRVHAGRLRPDPRLSESCGRRRHRVRVGSGDVRGRRVLVTRSASSGVAAGS